MDIVIKSAINGYIIEYDGLNGKESDVFEFVSDEESVQLETFIRLLWTINQHIGPTTSKYSSKRLNISTEEGEKYCG